MDVLTPICKTLDHPNLIFSKHSEIFKVENILFTHFSVYDNLETYTELKTRKNNEKNIDYNIALFHGVVSGANIENEEYLISSKSVPVEFFNGYDYTLLGDIHKQQYLNKEKTIAYAGSLIQQNFGEDLVKGFLVWDIEKSKVKFEEVPNDYGFVTVENVDDIDSLPKKSRIRILHKDMSVADIDAMVTEISKLTSIQELRVNSTEVKRIVTERINIDDVSNVKDVVRQNRFIKDFIDLTGVEADDDTLQDLYTLNEALNKELTISDSMDYSTWSLNRFEFENMFSYGENNVVNFSSLNGVVGIFASNRAGKSSLFDALMFCLFDRCTKTNKAAHVMRRGASGFKCKLSFYIDNVEYIIERTANKGKNDKVSVAVEFGRIVNGEYESLNGQQRSDTNKTIVKYIGSYDDFILTALSTQIGNVSIIDMTQKERQELLYRFLDIGIFNELFEISKSKLKEYQAENKYKFDIDYVTRISELETLNSEYNIKLKSIDKLLGISDKKLQGQQELIEAETKKLKNIQVPSLSINACNSKIDSANIKIQQCNKYKNEQADKLKSLRSKLQELQSIEIIDTEELETEISVLEGLLSADKVIDRKVRELELEIKHLQSNVDKLKTHEYDPECKFCVANPFVVDAMHSADMIKVKQKELTKLNKDRISVEMVQEDLTKFRETVKEAMGHRLALATTESAIKDCKAETQRLIYEIEQAEADIEKYKKMISDHEEMEEDIKYNEEVNESIQSLKSILNELRSDNSKVLSDQASIKRDIVHTTREITKLTGDKEKSEELKHLIRLLEIYTKAMSRDGIPYMILKNVLPIIESEVNELIQNICQFKFKLEIDDNDDVEGYIQNEIGQDYPIELASGMERFTISTAMRMVLLRMSSLVKPTFMVIDEGFGVLDKENIHTVPVLLNELKKNFSFIICISHLQQMRDAVDSTIHIDKVDGVSAINLL